MKRAAFGSIVLALIVAAASIAAAAEQKSLRQILDELLPGMSAESIPGRQGPQQQWQEICLQLGAPGNEAQRAEACKLMAEKLGPETGTPARIWLLKQLEFIGRGECVDAVAVLLDDSDEHVRDAARRALANNPTPQANAKLVAKMQSTREGGFKVGLINALGYRADPASAVALAEALDERDPAVAAAAARALGKIGSAEAAGRLAAARTKAQGEVRFRISDAYLLCADTMLKQGQADQAAAIYRELNKPDEPRPVRLAALQGLLNAAGDRAAETVIELLAGDDADARAIATGHVGNLSPGAVRSLAAAVSKLPPAGQVLLLEALASRGDKAAMPVAVAAAKSQDEEVRLAGLRALGTLGDASVVGMLIETMFAGGDAGGAARRSLEMVYGEGADQKIVAAMRAAQDLGQRATLIEILERRQAVLAVPALLEEALHEDANIRRRAMAALGRLAEPDDVPAMIRAVLKAEKGGERDDAEKAVMFVCNRIAEEEQRADPVLAVLPRADVSVRCVLLPLVGRIGGSKALEAVHEAMKSDSAELREAGLRALCNWPDAGVAGELLELSQRAEPEAHRLWALRAFIRVIALPSQRPDAEKLALLKKAVGLAARDEERRLILQRAAAIRRIETLRFVVPYLDNEALAQRACQTVVELAHHRDLREPNKAEFDKALARVIEICKDRGTVERAERYMQGLD